MAAGGDGGRLGLVVRGGQGWRGVVAVAAEYHTPWVAGAGGDAAVMIRRRLGLHDRGDREDIDLDLIFTYAEICFVRFLIFKTKNAVGSDYNWYPTPLLHKPR